jgi:hypothetical protein
LDKAQEILRRNGRIIQLINIVAHRKDVSIFYVNRDRLDYSIFEERWNMIRDTSDVNIEGNDISLAVPNIIDGLLGKLPM